MLHQELGAIRFMYVVFAFAVGGMAAFYVGLLGVQSWGLPAWLPSIAAFATGLIFAFAMYDKTRPSPEVGLGSQ